MSQLFHISGIEPGDAAFLFNLDDETLAERGAMRVRASTKPGFPCRVSLTDAEPGEELILFHYKHHAVSSPYQASGPIFVRRNAPAANLKPGETPDYLAHRVLSLRAYNTNAMIVKAQTAPGDTLQTALTDLFGNPEVEYVHIHNAAYGCFLCKAEKSM